MNQIDTFKDTKRKLKQNLNSLEEQIEKIESIEDFDKLSKLVATAKQTRIQIDRQYAEMENQWKLLNPSEKASYKAKLTKFKERHQTNRTNFKR